VRWALVAVLLACPGRAPAQDTLRPRMLDPVVVTAERAATGLASSVAAVTRLSAAELARMPQATLADVLRRAPGFVLVDFDGLGFDPQVMVRGFYGGGEAEYVVVQVDGRAVNQLQTGIIAWDVLPPLASIEAVEIVRGGGSPLYGDAAIAGVINIITRPLGTSRAAAELRGDAAVGTRGVFRAAAELRVPRRGKPIAFSGAVDRTDGFREHAGRTAVRGSLRSSPRGVNLDLRGHWREFEEPGPLLESLHALNRRGSDPLFRFDRTTDRGVGMSLEGSRPLGRSRLGAAVNLDARTLEAVRTLALTPGFGDTKERRAETVRGSLTVQLETADTPLPGQDHLVVGIEGNRGTLDSRYYRYAGGTREEYAAAPGQRGDLDTRGESARTGGGFYAQYVVQASDALRLVLGGRFDALRDSFDPSIPAGQEPHVTTHSALSPKVGLNLRYANGRTGSGHAYAAVSRSFKAPTLDQLYDLRNVPVPFPPFEIRTSNPELAPQHGVMVETGIYHGGEVSSGVRGSVSVSAYQIDMKDELDFDVSSFRYVNLGKSRHRGIEVGGNLDGQRVSAFITYALQAATTRSGPNAGKRLKAIPRNALTAGMSFQPLGSRRFLHASLMGTHVRDIHLDDANTVALPDYARLDAQIEFRVAGIRARVDVRNLLNERYSTSGFLDPGGSGEAYLFPAAGRVLEVGIRSGW
jgi:iron complex outermembrane receptor protein